MKFLILIFIIVLISFGIYSYFREESAFEAYLKNPIVGTHLISVNPDAPILAQNEILIDASSSRVWEVLSDVNRWPNWQSEVTEANLKTEPAAGTEFTWSAGGVSFVSKFHTAKPPIYLGWTGRTFGAYAIHNWVLEEQNGKTLVKVEESLEGLLPAWMTGYFEKNLKKGMQQNLEDLKAEAEKQSN